MLELYATNKGAAVSRRTTPGQLLIREIPTGGTYGGNQTIKAILIRLTARTSDTPWGAFGPRPLSSGARRFRYSCGHVAFGGLCLAIVSLISFDLV